jgi:hypothetical protein
MKKLLPIILSSIMFFGCSTFKDAEIDRQDIDKAMVVVHNDIEPKLIELKAIIETAEADYRKDREQAKAFWKNDLQPRLAQLEKMTDSITDALDNKLLKAKQLWQKDIEPRVARLEHLLADIEAKVDGKLEHALVTWHKDVEGHLSQLEHLSQTSKKDLSGFADKYRKLKVDLRSIKVRIAGNEGSKQAVNHVNTLILLVETLDNTSTALLTKSKIAALRAEIEKEVSATLRAL